MDVLIEITRLLHSWTRWLVVIVALVTLVIAVIGALQKLPFKPSGERWLRIFTIVISIQWAIGILNLIALGSQTGFGVRHYWEHFFATTLAVGVASMARRIYERRQLNDSARHWATVGVVVIVAILVVIGIAALPTGIQWRFYVPA